MSSKPPLPFGMDVGQAGNLLDLAAFAVDQPEVAGALADEQAAVIRQEGHAPCVVEAFRHGLDLVGRCVLSVGARRGNGKGEQGGAGREGENRREWRPRLRGMVLSLVGEVAFSQSIWARRGSAERPLSDHVRLKARLKRSVKSRPVGVGEDQRFGGELGDVRQGRQRQERGAQEPKAAQARRGVPAIGLQADLARFRPSSPWPPLLGFGLAYSWQPQEERGRLPQSDSHLVAYAPARDFSHLRLGPAASIAWSMATPSGSTAKRCASPTSTRRRFSRPRMPP